MFNIPYKQRTIGSLNVLEVPGDPQGPVVILMHGYGANAFDLLPLCQEIKTLPGTTWYFPDAPSEIEIGPGFMGRAWFPIDLAAFERAMATATAPEPGEDTLEGIERARKAVFSMIDELGVPLSRIFLGGFSQGATLAVDCSLEAATNAAGLIILSGTLINKKKWAELLPNRKGLRFFQSHGALDVVLPHMLAQELESLLLDGGLRGNLLSFQGGHEIPLSVIQALGTFLTESPGS